MALETSRLILRQWHDSDFPPFAALNADPIVMEYFPSTLSADQSDAMARRCQTLIAERGWGFWAVELKAQRGFIGFVGLHKPKASLPCSPCVEIGWRLAKAHWGHGYATEAANKALEYAFKELELGEVVSFTSMQNKGSIAVMERLGLSNTGEDFLHPDIPRGHWLSEHVLYKITDSEWLHQNNA